MNTQHPRITTTTLVRVPDGFDTTVTIDDPGIFYMSDWHFYTEEQS